MDAAFVTLATNDSYCIGALVVASSLRLVNTTSAVVCMITPEVSESMRQVLEKSFNQVYLVDILDSRDADNLLLLDRPNLGVTFTKLHCWRLDQYKKCVFVDADTLVLSNCDELFEREEFSAAPDPGWPDCFNSGVFVYAPSKDTYTKLVEFAVKEGSFDGADQGLLNLYFADWAHKDISKHLPFLYNVVSQAFYSYLPAFKRFGSETKICHFIGPVKPWHHRFDEHTGTAVVQSATGFNSEFLQKWWEIFMTYVRPLLTQSHAPSATGSLYTPPRKLMERESVTKLKVMTTRTPPPSVENGEPDVSQQPLPSLTESVEIAPVIAVSEGEEIVDQPPPSIENVEPDTSQQPLPTMAESEAVETSPVMAAGEEEIADESPPPTLEEMYNLWSEDKIPFHLEQCSFQNILSHIEQQMGDNTAVKDWGAASAPHTTVEQDTVMPQLANLSLSYDATAAQQQCAASGSPRQENWEKGIIDYTGVDSFEEIKRHINMSLSAEVKPAQDVRPKVRSTTVTATGSEAPDTRPKELKQSVTPTVKPIKSALKKPKD